MHPSLMAFLISSGQFVPPKPYDYAPLPEKSAVKRDRSKKRKSAARRVR